MTTTPIMEFIEEMNAQIVKPIQQGVLPPTLASQVAATEKYVNSIQPLPVASYILTTKPKGDKNKNE